MQEQTIDLEEVTELSEPTAMTEFPCVLLDGVETENEFLFFHNRTVLDPEMCVPMYFECENEIVKLGQFPLTLDWLLSLRAIGDYTVTLFTEQNTSKVLDLNDPVTLQKFIKL